MADREKSHETSCKNRAVLYRKNSRTGLLKVSCDTFLALSHGETSFMKPNLMRLVASCDTALRRRGAMISTVASQAEDTGYESHVDKNFSFYNSKTMTYT